MVVFLLESTGSLIVARHELSFFPVPYHASPFLNLQVFN